MKNKIYHLLFLLFLACSSFNTKTITGTLIVEVENIKDNKGIIWVGLYDSERNFLIKENATVIEGVLVGQKNRQRFELKDLALGTYAMALVHDVNHNGEMDTNFIGIPTEPYGFSQLPRSKWRIPRFEEVQFDFKQSQQVLNITLERW